MFLSIFVNLISSFQSHRHGLSPNEMCMFEVTRNDGPHLFTDERDKQTDEAYEKEAYKRTRQRGGR